MSGGGGGGWGEGGGGNTEWLYLILVFGQFVTFAGIPDTLIAFFDRRGTATSQTRSPLGRCHH